MDSDFDVRFLSRFQRTKLSSMVEDTNFMNNYVVFIARFPQSIKPAKYMVVSMEIF